jgi:hypothetical protein
MDVYHSTYQRYLHINLHKIVTLCLMISCGAYVWRGKTDVIYLGTLSDNSVIIHSHTVCRYIAIPALVLAVLNVWILILDGH